ncbi:MAG: hypothetical protein ACM3O6_08510 [Acidobacteriota bacterium]
MRLPVSLLLAILILGIAPASAQSYRGKWEAAGEKSGRCPAFYAHITVNGNKINIGIGGASTYRLTGTVAPDGSFSAEGTNGSTKATGQFTGDTVNLTLFASCGTRTGTGHRAS